MRERRIQFIFCFALLTCSVRSWSQETVFSVLKTDRRLADEYYTKKNYRKALALYWNLYQKQNAAGELKLKIARCYHFLKEYKQAVAVWEPYVRSQAGLSSTDLFYYAESQTSAGNYTKAIEAYREYLRRFPGDDIATQKLWRLNNIHFLYSDSLYFAVRRVPLSTEAGELFPVPYKNGIVFLSNRPEVRVVESIEESNSRFYRSYFATAAYDTLTGQTRYGKAGPFNKRLQSKFHAGPACFYSNGKKMIFASTGAESHSLHLYFAEEKHGEWKVTASYPFNSNKYSVTDPSISTDGTILYFSSDMPGGFGGKDIYRSEFKNGKWTAPENLGEAVNTIYDEVSPFLHVNGTLYFSSNGHPGMGGLDIFRIPLQGAQVGNVVNVGYPINSYADDFGIVIDSLSTHGYFSSNRKALGLDDDLYEFEMNIQSYPLVLSGVIHMKDHDWSDSSALTPVVKAKFLLIDNLRNIVVQEGTTDDNGNFTMHVPYFSQYKISITGADNDEHIVSLEIPRYRRMNNKHEIVIVKDLFRPAKN